MRKYRRVGLVTLQSDAKFEEKLTLVPKMTWGIWGIVMQAVASLKIFTLIGYFLSLVCNVWAKEI